jgi:hypothetical protein
LQHALNRLRIDLLFVHKLAAQAVTQVVKTEVLPFRKNDPALVAAGRRWSSTSVDALMGTFSGSGLLTSGLTAR